MPSLFSKTRPRWRMTTWSGAERSNNKFADNAFAGFAAVCCVKRASVMAAAQHSPKTCAVCLRNEMLERITVTSDIRTVKTHTHGVATALTVYLNEGPQSKRIAKTTTVPTNDMRPRRAMHKFSTRIECTELKIKSAMCLGTKCMSSKAKKIGKCVRPKSKYICNGRVCEHRPGSARDPSSTFLEQASACGGYVWQRGCWKCSKAREHSRLEVLSLHSSKDSEDCDRKGRKRNQHVKDST